MKLAALALLPLSLSLLPGCPCGAYAGGGDVVYQRGADMLIECDNGGFVADVGSSPQQEGRYANAVGIGANGGLAYDQIANADGTITTPQLGSGAWTAVALDTVQLDHADALCQALVTRTWWAAPSDAVPAATVLIDPSTPTNELVLCPNYSLHLTTATGSFGGDYTLVDGAVDASTTNTQSEATPPDASGALSASGTFVFATSSVATTTWTTALTDNNALTFCQTGVYQ